MSWRIVQRNAGINLAARRHVADIPGEQAPVRSNELRRPYFRPMAQRPEQLIRGPLVREENRRGRVIRQNAGLRVGSFHKTHQSNDETADEGRHEVRIRRRPGQAVDPPQYITQADRIRHGSTAAARVRHLGTEIQSGRASSPAAGREVRTAVDDGHVDHDSLVRGARAVGHGQNRPSVQCLDHICSCSASDLATYRTWQSSSSTTEARWLTLT